MASSSPPTRGAPAGSAPPPSPLVLAIIRIALLLGVLAFGAMTLFIRRRGDWRPAPADSLDTLRTAGIVIWVLATLAVLFLRLRGTRLAGRAGPAARNIIAWAIGEAVAVFGGVYFFLAGQPAWYLNGVMFLVATFVLFPIRTDR